MNLRAPVVSMQNYPNPASDMTTFKIRVSEDSKVALTIYEINGSIISVPLNENKQAGTYEINLDLNDYKSGIYFAMLSSNGETIQSVKFSIVK